jgi:hypothetical protein
LRLLDGLDGPHVLSSRARLLAHWAESAALLGEKNLMEEKLAASAALLQAQALFNLGEIKRSVEAVRASIPLIAVAESPLIFRGLIDHVQKLTVTFPRDGELIAFAKEVQYHPQLRNLHAHVSGPRYLEATL